MGDNLIAPANTSTTLPWAAVAWSIGIVVALVALILLIRWVKKAFGRPELYGMSREQVQKRWDDIEKTANTSPLAAKMAIMEADKLLDAALKSMAMSGNTLGERLKFAGYKYPELRKVWDAHRLRNRIVHEATFEPGRAEISAALRDFKRALQTLKLL